MAKISLIVNGNPVNANVDPRTLLVQFLRENLRLTGTHVGCDTSQCGACVVHLDGKPVRSCLTQISHVGNGAVTTIEGIGDTAVGARLQKAWLDVDVVQCGYCQPGQIMSAASLLTRIPSPSDDDIESAMNGNICRCGTYTRIREAIKQAAKIDLGSAATKKRT